MKTTCNILVFGNECESGKFIYRENEGAPLPMLDDLKSFIKATNKIIDSSDELAARVVEWKQDDYGVCENVQVDADYMYIVFPFDGHYYINVSDFKQLYNTFTKSFGEDNGKDAIIDIFNMYKRSDFANEKTIKYLFEEKPNSMIFEVVLK